MLEIKKVIELKVSGKFAHFRKFYTNSSSLSYLIPPKTVVIGLLASILEFERDSYYDVFNDLFISVLIPRGFQIRKQFYSVNYLHNDFYNFLTKGNSKYRSVHSQNKMELLLPPLNFYKITYSIFLGGSEKNEILFKIENKLKKNEFGYGVYLGQRPFKGNVELINSYKEKNIKFLANSKVIHSAFTPDNIISIKLNENINLVKEKMPYKFKPVKKGAKMTREPVATQTIFFEKSGNEVEGEFKNCYQIKEKVIAFY